MRILSLTALVLLCLSMSCGRKGINGDTGNPTGDAANLRLDGPTAFQYWLHEPLHPGTNRPVTFTTKLTDSLGIRRVELYLKEYELHRDADGLPARRKRPSGVWGKVREWTFPDRPVDAELDHKYAEGFPAASNVMYVFRVYNGRGQVTDRMAHFDAGKSPWPKDKILLYSTNIRPMQENINLCFLPDKDYRNNRSKFLDDTRELIVDGFQRNNMIGYAGIDKWQYFYSNHPLNGKLLLENYNSASYFPKFLREKTIEGIDAFGLLHQEEYTDQTLPVESVWFLANNFFTAESHNFGTAVHEAAHAIFKLSDEYEQCVCFEVNSTTGNVFSKRRDCESEKPAGSRCREVMTNRGETWYTFEDEPLFTTRADCEAYNRRNGITGADCIGWFENGRQFYLSEPATCIMWDDGDDRVRDFMPACASVIANYYDQLERGRSFVESPAARDASSISYGERQANIFGYERVVRLSCETSDVEWNLRVDDVRYGIPEKNILDGRDVNLRALDQTGAATFSVSMDPPDYVYFHSDGGATDSLLQTGGGQFYLNIPYDSTLVNVAIDRKKRVRSRSGMQSYDVVQSQDFFNIKDQLDREVKRGF